MSLSELGRRKIEEGAMTFNQLGEEGWLMDARQSVATWGSYSYRSGNTRSFYRSWKCRMEGWDSHRTRMIGARFDLERLIRGLSPCDQYEVLTPVIGMKTRPLIDAKSCPRRSIRSLDRWSMRSRWFQIDTNPQFYPTNTTFNFGDRFHAEILWTWKTFARLNTWLRWASFLHIWT